MFLALALSSVLGLLAQSSTFEPLGRFDLQAIPESSGIVKSRRHPDVFWVHNDSGNPPTLFAVDRRGTHPQQRSRSPSPTSTGKTSPIDDQGRLYIGDIGNNGGRLAIRMIHQIAEPDPEQAVGGPAQAVGVVVLRHAAATPGSTPRR